MRQNLTKKRVPRGTCADAETGDKIYLIKNVSLLRATYQVRLLTFKAMQTQKKLILKVPNSCRFHASLNDLMNKAERVIEREDL